MDNVINKTFAGLAICSIFLLIAMQMTSSQNAAGNKANNHTAVKKPVDSLAIDGNNKSRKIQVVFALDATGSMTGLIGAAKEKIWSIASSFTQADSAVVEMGIVFYRDRGDDFVTKHIFLSSDLDNVYEQLMAIDVLGGGDSPESVNQGLYEAIEKMEWSKDSKALRCIFLVGDQPPHMDYREDVKYMESCERAKNKDIILNTILMGNDSQAKAIWKKIAACGEGDFMQMNMDANNLAVNTPYDEQIAELSSKMDETRFYYGSDLEVKKQLDKVTQSQKLKSISAATAARRAEYNNSSKAGKISYIGENELISDYKEGKVKIDTISKEKLPGSLAKMSLDDRKIFIEKTLKRRDSLDNALKHLIQLRKDHVENELAKKDEKEVKESFDYAIYENVKKQAERKKIFMKGKAKL